MKHHHAYILVEGSNITAIYPLKKNSGGAKAIIHTGPYSLCNCKQAAILSPFSGLWVEIEPIRGKWKP